MKALAEVLAGILIVAASLALFFLFDGTPDLWDKWHAAAMGKECKAEHPSAPLE